MALVTSFDDVKANQVRFEGDAKRGTKGGALATDFFDFRDNPDLPHAALYQFDPGRVSHPHFHIVDQFQVVVGGKAKLGRRDVAAYGVHFSRAYTPYGPFISDPDIGLTCFVMHANTRTDWRSRHLPEKQDELKRAPNRHPWQITFPVVFPELHSGAITADTLLQAVPGVEDEKRLVAYALSMKPNALGCAPDPSCGDGQYLVVVKGSLFHNNKEHKSLALVFVGSNEGPFQIRAGSEGLQAIVLNYPHANVKSTGAAISLQPTSGFKTWQCTQCAFVYDEAVGLLAEGIAPGTRWQDVPDTWSCPDCGASKADFGMIAPANVS